MRVLVAPDKFRGTLTAVQAAEAVEAGWHRHRPGDEIVLVPMADGGEGTMEALIGALGGQKVSITVPGPLGDPFSRRSRYAPLVDCHEEPFDRRFGGGHLLLTGETHQHRAQMSDGERNIFSMHEASSGSNSRELRARDDLYHQSVWKGQN